MSRALVPIAVVPVCLALVGCYDTATAPRPTSDSSVQRALPTPGMPLAPSSGPLAPADPSGVGPGVPPAPDVTLLPLRPGLPDAGAPSAEAPETLAPEPALDPAAPEGAAESAEPEPTEPDEPALPEAPAPEALPPSTALPEESFPTPSLPSAGCQSENPEPAQGLASLILNDTPADYLLSLPDGYDGSQPVPLIFGFHGRARTYLEFAREDATEIERLAARAVMLYPQSQGGEGWTHEAELAPNLAFFDELYALVAANHCVDLARVFAIGHSSGGFFSHVLACRHGDLLRGIGVVAGAREESDCNGYVAALLIHGQRDSVVEFERGEAARDAYLARNGCSQASWSAAVEPCRAYTACEAGLPVVWCTHDEPTYEDTNHGWPSFASRALEDFLFSLP
jgi:polyhydroxybutyrate depolymerase